ncbi:M16 family metallopeptidase [Salegentibacter sp. HM20]
MLQENLMKFWILIFGIISFDGFCQETTGIQIQKWDSIPLDPEVRYGKLENGFTYYLRKNNEPNNTIELRLVLKAGHLHEDEDQLEYAHLLEHLLAAKTKSFKNINEYINQIGGYSNAKTGSRYTIYEARIPSHDQFVIKETLQLLRDWAQAVHWDSEVINIQRGAVEGEMRVSDPYRKWKGNTLIQEALFNSGYKIYSDEKRLESLQNFNIKAFKQYYKDWYRPDLQAAIIVGDINIDSMENEIKRRFSDLKTPTNPKSSLEILDSYQIELNNSNRFTTVPDNTIEDLELQLIRLRPNFKGHPKTMKDYKQMLLQQLYTIMLHAKASQVKRQYKPPFSGFSSDYGATHIPDQQLDGSLMSINFETDSLQQLKKQFQRGLLTWKQMHQSIDSKSFEEAKTSILKKFKEDNLIPSNFLIQKYVQHFTYGKAAPHPEIEKKLVSKILSEIEMKDLELYISKYGNLDTNSVFIFFKGTSFNMPNYKVFKEWMKETDTMEVAPLKEEQVIKSLANVVHYPLSENRESFAAKENEIGITTLELPNGIKLALKPTSPSNPNFSQRVSLLAFRPNSVPLEDRMEYLAAKMAPEVVPYTGAGPYDKFELDSFLREKGVYLNFKSDKDNQTIYATSKVNELPELFNLLYLYLNEPRLDPEAFLEWKKYKMNQLERKVTSGSESFIMDKIYSIWYPEVPVLESQDLTELSLEQVFQAWKKWFSGIEDFTFVVTGDFNKDTIIRLLANNFTALANENPKKISKPNFNFPLKKMEEKMGFKNIDQVYARLFFPIKVPRSIKNQIELRLLSKALNQRIYNKLRNGSYIPRANGEWIDIKNSIFAFRIDFDSALGNEEKMLSYALEEFRKLREEGVEREWLETTIKNELRTYESGFNKFGNFNFWQDFLQIKLEEKEEDMVSDILNYGTMLEHFINLEDINLAAKKYLSEEHLQQFLGYPEEYIKPIK